MHPKSTAAVNIQHWAVGQPDLEVGRPALESGQWEDRLGIQQDKAVVQQGCELVAGTLKDDRLGLVGTVEGKAVNKSEEEGGGGG